MYAEPSKGYVSIVRRSINRRATRKEAGPVSKT
jgi:hypothetical protein